MAGGGAKGSHGVCLMLSVALSFSILSRMLVESLCATGNDYSTFTIHNTPSVLLTHCHVMFVVCV